MLTPSPNKASGNPSWALRVPLLAGAAAVLVGMLVILGWCAHWTTVLQVSSHLPVMQFNTALMFILSGSGLIALTFGRWRMATVLGGVCALFAAVVLLENFTGWNLGIDELFFHPYLQVNSTFPGRISPLSAGCFLFFDIGLVAAAVRPQWVGRLAITGVASCVAMCIAMVALVGYVLEIDAAAGWGSYTHMALHTAATAFVLGGGLFLWSWQQSRREQFDFLRWVPITGSASLMLMIGIVSLTSLSGLRDTMFWREHSYQVLNEAGLLLDGLTDTDRGLRGYVLTGDPAALVPYRNGTNTVAVQLTALINATRDNPSQQKRLKTIRVDLDAVILYSRQLIVAKDSGGLPAAIQWEKTGAGLRVADRVRADIDAFSQEEHLLLSARDLATTNSLNAAARLFVFGSILAAGLLVLANIIAGREARRRSRAEAMQQALHARIEETSALQKAILSSANYAIVSTTTDGTITTFNPTAERMLGYAATDVIGSRTPAIWHDPAETVARSLVLSAEFGRPVEPGFETFVAKARQGGVDENEWTFVRKDGTRLPVLASITALTGDGGRIVGFLGVLADITARKRAEAKLRASEERFRSLIEEIKDCAIFGLDIEGRVASWNSGAQRIKGYQADEITGRYFAIFYPPEAIADHKPERNLAEAAAKGYVNDEGWRVRKDGTRFYASVLITALHGEDGKVSGFSKVTRDITESWRAEESLRLSEERFRSAFDGAPIGMALVSPEGRWLKVNRAICRMVGYSEMELLQTDFQHITHPDDLEKDLDFVRQIIAGRILSYQMEKRYFHKDGAVVYVMLNVSLVRDREGQPLYFVAQIENITERKQAAEKIAASLREKEALLREIHHRVKNNMQVVSSILQLQSGYLKDPADLEIFRECQSRIRSMALIHEKLYRSEGLAHVDFKEYLHSLVSLLFRSHTPKGVTLRHEFNFEHLALDADTAIPLGLIANELLSNSLKHGFTGRTEGFVRVILKKYGEHGLQLIIQDDGQGLPPGFDPDVTGTLGVRLVKILCAQVKGRLEFKNTDGAEFIITLDHAVVSPVT